jgi:hypothetical protein
MMTKTTHIKDKPPTLEELQELVGGYIEVAYAPNGDQIIMDEEGKLKNKPINWEATEHWLGKKENYAIYPDVIVGDVIILSGNAKQE